MVAPNLLATKLYFPAARPNLVSRPRLVERLSNGLRGPITLVSAPAGYGKTTLLSEWHEGTGRGCPTAWLSLDAGDNDPARFLTYLAAALGAIHPGLVGSATLLLQTPQPPPNEAILVPLINDLDNVERDFTLVLDDYHIITASGVHHALTFLLDHLPARMHLVILTRADPPIPLARLRARGHLTEIRAEHLRFSHDELDAFLKKTAGVNLSPEDTTALELRTEGWIAGIQMAALSLQDVSDPHTFVTAFSGDDRHIGDYLIEEVLQRQPVEFQQFLMQTSVLDRMSASLCDAITDRKDSQVVLNFLERANLFLTPLDNHREWFRYHALFANLLRQRLNTMDVGAMQQLQRRAWQWFSQHGFVRDAINYAFACHDTDGAASLIEQNAWSLIERGELVTLVSWLNAVDALMPARPWLSIYRAWERVIAGRLDTIQPLLLKAEQTIGNSTSLSQEEKQNMLGHIATIQSCAAIPRREARLVRKYAHQALELLPPENLAVRSIATFSTGAACWLDGDIQCGRDAFAEAARLGRVAGNQQTAVSALRVMAYLETASGRLHHAADIYLETIQQASLQNGQPLPVAADAFIGIGNLEYEWNHLDKAAQYLEEAVELSQILGSADVVVAAKVSLGRLYRAHGDQVNASRLLREAEAVGEQSTLAPTYHAMLGAYRMRTYLDRGESAHAVRLAQESGVNIENAEDWLRQAEILMLARALLSQGEVEKALNLLERCLPLAESTERWGHVIELLAVKALSLKAAGNLPQALEVLGKALALAQPDGYVRLFLDEGSSMAELLRHAGSKGIHPQYVSRLLAQFDTVPGKAAISQQPLIEPLSERELEVLMLIADGKSNLEIAARLYLAVSTVKRHISNIFAKLSVQSRTQCLARARELHLL